MADRPVTEADVLAALAKVYEPTRLRDVVALGMVREIKICDGHVAFQLVFADPADPRREQLAGMCRTAVEKIPGVQTVNVRNTGGAPAAPPGGVRPATGPMTPPGGQPALLPGVRHVIAVGSGKGGVGKSTVAVNLAASLAADGARVGLLDADVYGPSIPTMTGAVSARAEATGEGRIRPLELHGLKLMSMGFLMPDVSAPVMWRGPMISTAVKQMLGDVAWGELDYMIVDLPPGTGDVPLTLAQSLPLTGVVVVMTSQDVAVNIATKALHFFQRLNVPILGIVENMAAFVCPHCHTETPIFSRGGGQQRARELDVPFLGSVPLDGAIVEHGDQGVPTVTAAPESPQARAFREIARAVAEQAQATSVEQPLVEVVRRP
jgi:ATP-binding protein involved in chromosome partitioning